MTRSSGSNRTLDTITRILAFPFRLLLPLAYPLRRILFLVMAKVRLPALPASVQIDGPITIIGTADIEIGATSRISRQVELGTEEAGRIQIGENVRINRGTTIFAYDEVVIGDHCMIGEFVTVRDANHGIAPDELIRSQGHVASTITIGRDVWLGRGVVVLPGVTIGDGCVIGANSVVTKDIEAGMIAVGSPAKAIRKR